jgi:hypothetical protein
MAESFCRVGDDRDLLRDLRRSRRSRACLLVMGLGTQMLGWHEDFCATSPAAAST